MNLGTFSITQRSMAPSHRYMGFWNHGTWRHWHFGFTGRPVGIVTVLWFGRGWRPWSRTNDTTMKIDVADAVVELFIAYTFNRGSTDYFAGGCWNPGDPAELDIEKVEIVTRDNGVERYVEAQPWLYDIVSNSTQVFEHIAEQHQRDDEPDYDDRN